MENKKIIKIDLNGIKDSRELQERIRVAFDFPEWYGASWDAFKDLLFTECDADEVHIYGEKSLSESFSEHIDIMHNILSKFCDERNYYVTLYSDCKPFSFTVID